MSCEAMFPGNRLAAKAAAASATAQMAASAMAVRAIFRPIRASFLFESDETRRGFRSPAADAAARGAGRRSARSAAVRRARAGRSEAGEGSSVGRLLARLRFRALPSSKRPARGPASFPCAALVLVAVRPSERDGRERRREGRALRSPPAKATRRARPPARRHPADRPPPAPRSARPGAKARRTAETPPAQRRKSR